MPEENKQENSHSSPDMLDKIIVSETKIDKILTQLKNLLKKHWGIILLIALGYFIYWAFNLPEEKPKKEIKQDVWTFELNEQGDTIWYLNDTLYENK